MNVGNYCLTSNKGFINHYNINVEKDLNRGGGYI